MLQDEPQEMRGRYGAPFSAAALRVAIAKAHLALGAGEDIALADDPRYK
jgi:hypothetical protein